MKKIVSKILLVIIVIAFIIVLIPKNVFAYDYSWMPKEGEQLNEFYAETLRNTFQQKLNNYYIQNGNYDKVNNIAALIHILDGAGYWKMNFTDKYIVINNLYNKWSDELNLLGTTEKDLLSSSSRIYFITTPTWQSQTTDPSVWESMSNDLYNKAQTWLINLLPMDGGIILPEALTNPQPYKAYINIVPSDKQAMKNKGGKVLDYFYSSQGILFPYANNRYDNNLPNFTDDEIRTIKAYAQIDFTYYWGVFLGTIAVGGLDDTEIILQTAEKSAIDASYVWMSEAESVLVKGDISVLLNNLKTNLIQKQQTISQPSINNVTLKVYTNYGEIDPSTIMGKEAAAKALDSFKTSYPNVKWSISPANASVREAIVNLPRTANIVNDTIQAVDQRINLSSKLEKAGFQYGDLKSSENINRITGKITFVDDVYGDEFSIVTGGAGTQSTPKTMNGTIILEYRRWLFSSYTQVRELLQFLHNMSKANPYWPEFNLDIWPYGNNSFIELGLRDDLAYRIVGARLPGESYWKFNYTPEWGDALIAREMQVRGISLEEAENRLLSVYLSPDESLETEMAYLYGREDALYYLEKYFRQQSGWDADVIETMLLKGF